MNKKTVQNIAWGILYCVWTAGTFLIASNILVGLPISFFASQAIYEWFLTPVGIFVLGAIVYTVATAIAMAPFYIKRLPWGAIRERLGITKPHWRMILWALAAWACYFFATAVAAALLQLVPSLDLSQKQDIGFSMLSGPWEYILAFLTLVVIAPIFEELLFRGFLFGQIRERSGFWFSAVLTSLTFAALHGQLNVGIDVFILSMVLCYLREKKQSVLPGMLVHAIKNGLAYTLLFILPLYGVRLI